MFRSLGNILGLFQLDKWQFGRDIVIPVDSAGIQVSAPLALLIMERNEAREQKDFKKADEIRQFLLETHGIVIEDKPYGTSRWKR